MHVLAFVELVVLVDQVFFAPDCNFEQHRPGVVFGFGQLFELDQLQAALVVRVLPQERSQFRVRVRDAVEVDVHERLGHHAVEEHGQPHHAHDAVHELRDLAEHEVGRHLQDAQQAFQGNVLPVQIVLQNEPQLGLLAFIGAIFSALHA